MKRIGLIGAATLATIIGCGTGDQTNAPNKFWDDGETGGEVGIGGFDPGYDSGVGGYGTGGDDCEPVCQDEFGELLIEIDNLKVQVENNVDKYLGMTNEAYTGSLSTQGEVGRRAGNLLCLEKFSDKPQAHMCRKGELWAVEHVLPKGMEEGWIQADGLNSCEDYTINLGNMCVDKGKVAGTQEGNGALYTANKPCTDEYKIHCCQ